MMQRASEVIKAHFLERVSEAPGRPIMLSGGIDCATILAAALALGSRPPCYSFRFGEYQSEDNRVAQSMCAAFNVPYHEVPVPRDEPSIIKDIRRVLLITGEPTKTHVQCSIPFIYLAKAVASCGFQEAWMGMFADALWGSSRHAAVALQGSEKAFRDYRAKDAANEKHSDFSVVKVAERFGVILHDPWRDVRLTASMLDMAFADMHKPFPKYAAVAAFPEFWSAGKWRRPNKSLQVVAGIRAAHDLLLQSSVNRRGHKAVIGIYNDILNGRA